jgi:cycloeucalenol cycloisomerase
VLSEDPDKRWTEKFILIYSPVWIAVIVVVMATQAFTRWGDLGHMALGVGLTLPLYVVPLLLKKRGHIWRYNLWVGLFGLLQTYFGSYLFFDVLHMEYHFPVTWILNRTPLFLYFLTIVYFSTYYVVMSILWRQVKGGPLEIPALLVLGYATAFAETGGMANQWLHDYFIYRDKWFVLLWGSAVYGSIFVLSLPYVFRLGPSTPPKKIVGEVLAVNMAALIAYEGWAWLLR